MRSRFWLILPSILFGNSPFLPPILARNAPYFALYFSVLAPIEMWPVFSTFPLGLAFGGARRPPNVKLVIYRENFEKLTIYAL